MVAYSYTQKWKCIKEGEKSGNQNGDEDKTYIRSQQMEGNRWRKSHSFAILVLSSLLLSVITF